MVPPFLGFGVKSTLTEGSIRGHVPRGELNFFPPAFFGARRDAPTLFGLSRRLRVLKRGVVFGIYHFFGGGCSTGRGDLGEHGQPTRGVV